MVNVKVKTIRPEPTPPPPEYEVTLRLSKEELRMLKEDVAGLAGTISSHLRSSDCISFQKEERLATMLISIYSQMHEQGCR